jgi:hypothetical protein
MILMFYLPAVPRNESEQAPSRVDGTFAPA